MALDKKAIQARINGERTRALENIRARNGVLPKQQWWMSFADKEGFRGVVIAHGNDLVEALMDANLHQCNPHGEVRAMPVPPQAVIPAEWTYRVLSRTECEHLDNWLLKTYKSPQAVMPASLQ